MIFLIIVAGLVVCFAGVLAFGAPYLPTLRKQINLALELAELKPGQTLLELGSGDGRVALAAARKGLCVVGYELNPLLVLISLIVTWHHRALVKIRWGNFLSADWPPAEAIFIFGINRLMPKIDSKIKCEVQGPTRLVSYAFEIPGKKPLKTKDGLFLYKYH